MNTLDLMGEPCINCRRPNYNWVPNYTKGSAVPFEHFQCECGTWTAANNDGRVSFHIVSIHPGPPEEFCIELAYVVLKYDHGSDMSDTIIVHARGVFEIANQFSGYVSPERFRNLFPFL